jgi:hypothetical protein
MILVSLFHRGVQANARRADTQVRPYKISFIINYQLSIINCFLNCTHSVLRPASGIKPSLNPSRKSGQLARRQKNLSSGSLSEKV